MPSARRVDKSVIIEHIINATGGGGSGLRSEIASSADPGFAFAGPGDFLYTTLLFSNYSP